MHTTLYWFSNDLRLLDNPALTAALQQSEKIAFVYIVDPTWFSALNYNHRFIGERRYAFILESLLDLEQQLASQGHLLYVLQGDPLKILPSLIEHNDISLLGGAKQTGWFENKVWQQLIKLLPEPELQAHWANYLFPAQPWLDDESAENSTISQSLKSFSVFRRFVEKNMIKPVSNPADCLAAKTAPLLLKGQVSLLSQLYGELQLVTNKHNSETDNQIIFTAGERAGLAHLADYFFSMAPSSYKKTRNALDGWQQSTKFSPYLANGNLSPSQIWVAVDRYENDHVANEDTYWIKFELLWREYFQWLALSQGRSLYSFQGMATKLPLTSFFPERFQKWCQGNTPFPIVNACMKQLNATGFMSNRGRQLAASCLVNELAVDWRYGAAYFQQQLIDHDVASNWGNWQYLAGVGADPRGGRQFNLIKQTQTWDPDGEFVRKWQGQASEQPLDSLDAVGWPIESTIASESE
jgi:deoxyribodipyrimidine photo-lyase